MQGEAWKCSQINPLDRVRVAQLNTELEKPGVNTTGKKPQLEKDLEVLQKELVMSQQSYSKHQTLDSLNLEKYEVFPTEPLHDLKGHIHIIEEATKITSGETQQILKQVKSTILNKCTLWCSDFRTAAILIYQTLKQSNHPETPITELFRTAVEIAKNMCAPDSKRTPKAVLRLHNVAYQHGKICNNTQFQQESCLWSLLPLYHLSFPFTTLDHLPAFC